MRRFSRQSSFSSSPLCPSVPLDGTDTVLGLRALDNYQRASEQAEAVAGLAKHPGSVQRIQQPQKRIQYHHYKGPYLEQLTPQHLRKQPQDWQLFIGMESQTGARTSWAANFNVPENLAMLGERLEENIMCFLVSQTHPLAHHLLTANLAGSSMYVSRHPPDVTIHVYTPAYGSSNSVSKLV